MQQPSPQVAGQQAMSSDSMRESIQRPRADGGREQPCPQCGYPMSDLKGGREAVCHNCGFKDSCCY